MAEIVAVGTELLGSHRMDSNSLWLRGQLAELGLRLRAKHVVGDDEGALEEVARGALRHATLLVVTGGLGPTEDDVTRAAVARMLSRKLKLRQDLVDELRARFLRHGMAMPRINERQAMVPEGAEVVPNPAGTAPGLLMTRGPRTVLLLPGPPTEMRAVWARALPLVISRLPAVPRPASAMRRINVVGLGESRVDEIAAPIYRRHRRVTTTILFSAGQIELHLEARAPSAAEARRAADRLARRLAAALHPHVIGEGDVTLEQVVVERLRSRGERVALAESCTGGLVGHRLTQVPGASDVLHLGVVGYANWAKEEILRVSPSTLEALGAVSEQAVVEMAQGIRAMGRSSWGLAVSGIAGPGGGTPEKPVGTTWIALAGDSGVSTKMLRLPGAREQVKWLASQAALNMLRLAIV